MGYLHDYLLFNENNECPPIYTLWTALATLSTAVGLRVYKHYDDYEIYCNLYILLVGEAGAKKTTTRDIGKALLREALPDVILSASCESREGTIKFMDGPAQLRKFINHKGKLIEYRPMGIYCGEFSNYVSVDPIKMVNFLVDVYDGVLYDYRLKNEMQYLLKPYVVLLACAVPEFLTAKLKSSEFTGGFGRRAIMVCDESDIRKRDSGMSTEGVKARQRCLITLRAIQDVVGEAVFTPEAEAVFWQWRSTLTYPVDKFVRCWRRALHILVQKVAMLITVSETLGVIIQKPHIEMAIQLLTDVEKNFTMVTGLMGRGELNEPTANILRYLKDKGGWVTEKQLQKDLMLKEFKNVVEYIQVLNSLQHTEQIKRFKHTINGVVREIVALPECITKA